MTRPGKPRFDPEIIVIWALALIACVAVWWITVEIATTRLDLPPIPAKEAHP